MCNVKSIIEMQVGVTFKYHQIVGRRWAKNTHAPRKLHYKNAKRFKIRSVIEQTVMLLRCLIYESDILYCAFSFIV